METRDTSIDLIPNYKKQTLSYPGAIQPLCRYQKVGKKKEKAVIVVPLFLAPKTCFPALSALDRELIREWFRTKWGGHHHIMFMPNFLVRYYTTQLHWNKKSSEAK